MVTISEIMDKVTNDSYISDSEKWLICLLVYNGLRISEICDVRNFTYISDNEIIIYQKKTRISRRAVVLHYSNLTKEICNHLNFSRFNRNRWYYYRVFKRLGIYEKIIGHKVMSVTHLPRHKKAQEVMTVTNSLKEVANQLGHNGLRSVKYYLPTDKKNILNQRNILENPNGSIENLTITKTGVIYYKKK